MSDDTLKPYEYARLLREMIQNENNFVNQRLGWMSTFNGILFGVVYFLWKEAKQYHTIPIILICFAGFLIDLSILIALRASEKVRIELNNLWEKKDISKTEIPPVWGWGVIDKKDRKNRYLMPWSLIPLILMVCWGIIFLFHAFGF
jgi:hypothetical protein